jgi:methionyl aminopeptidase
MTTAGRHGVRIADDGWAIFSQDGSLASHFEFTVAITADGPRILTPWHGGGDGDPEVANIPGRAQVE